jgi:hypothetical protein
MEYEYFIESNETKMLFKNVWWWYGGDAKKKAEES